MKKRVHEKFMFLMKISLLQLLILSFAISLAHASDANGQGILDKKISIKFENRSLRDALTEIEKTAGVKFLFFSPLISDNEKISLNFHQESLEHILDRILSTRKIKYEADGIQIILKPASDKERKTYLENAEQSSSFLTISGQVLDDASQPLPGVSVFVKGTTTGTTTDVDGRFSLDVADKNAVLVFSFIGYVVQEKVIGDQTDFKIEMQPDITTLSEVVVVGYGTQKKTDVISSISTVEARDLTVRANPSFESGLQGLAAGVSVQSQSGSPGAPVRVLIRGTSSINLTTEPLYIIDGMPINLNNGGLGSSNISPMSLINQNDIENIVILKDAAATSIYGSRGSNGVILVTTKNGKRDGGAFTVNYSTGVSRLTRTPEDVGFASTREWFQIMDEAYTNSGTVFPDDMQEYYTKVPLANVAASSPKLTRQQAEAINTDWYDELFQLGTFQNINLSTSRGTENTAFYLSGNYRKDKGTQTNNNFERFTIRTNLDFNPSKNFTIGSKMTFGYTRNDQRNSGITSIAVDALPWLPVREPDNPGRYYNAYTGSNPVAVTDPGNMLNRNEQFRALGGIFLNYKVPFVKGLSLRSELSGDVMQSNRVVWQGGDIRLNSDNTKPQAAASEEAITFTGMNYNAYANYDHTFGEHAFSVVGGVEATRSSQYRRGMAGTGLNGIYQEIGSPSNLISIQGRKEEERYLLGYFGRFNYKLREKYMLGVSLRRDASSVFTADNRWETFVAVSAGWILSEEEFMSFIDQNTFLKLRGSYGETGNQNIPPNLNVVQYNTQPVVYGSADIQGVNGTIPTNIGVNNLKWESTKSSDVGLDFGFFNNRLNGSVAYYHRMVNGMLLEAGLPYSTGISSIYSIQLGQGTYARSSSIWGNFGDMVNSGLELELYAVNVDKGGFKWTTSFNVAFNKNQIKKLTEDIDESGGGLENLYGNAISRAGDRRAVWYIADYAGVDPQTGVPMIHALDKEAFAQDGSTVHLKNNVGEDVLLPATITNIRANRFYQDGKSGDPKYQGGITNTLGYKGFDFSFMLSFSGGNYILDYDRQQAAIVNPTRTILREVYDQSWKESGDQAKYPQLRAFFTYPVNGQNVDGFSGAEAYHNGSLYKGDFVRLRNVTLGYTVPASNTERLGIKSLRVYASGSNLFTSTRYPGFDPEGTGTSLVPGFIYYANAIPQLKTLTLGLDIQF